MARKDEESSQIEELKRKIIDIDLEVNNLWRTGKRDPEESRKYQDLVQSRLVLERELAEARGESYAVPFKYNDLDRKIFSESIRPLVLDLGTYVFVLYARNPPFDDPIKQIAVLRFSHCHGLKTGSPNDETIEGHSLFGRGIDVGESYIVHKSAWLEEIKNINKAHSLYNDEYWSNARHFLIFFKEITVECLAKDLRSEIVDGDVSQVVNYLLTQGNAKLY